MIFVRCGLRIHISLKKGKEEKCFTSFVILPSVLLDNNTCRDASGPDESPDNESSSTAGQYRCYSNVPARNEYPSSDECGERTEI
jgi:hypothetical protein